MNITNVGTAWDGSKAMSSGSSTNTSCKTTPSGSESKPQAESVPMSSPLTHCNNVEEVEEFWQDEVKLRDQAIKELRAEVHRLNKDITDLKHSHKS